MRIGRWVAAQLLDGPSEPRVAKLKAAVLVVREEFELAAAFHEAWKPMAYDTDLQARMGYSFATHTFRTIRLALRREMLMALVRLWDTHPKAVGMDKIARALRDARVISVLAREREMRSMFSEEEHLDANVAFRAAATAMFEDEGRKEGQKQVALLHEQVRIAQSGIAEYQRGGSKHSTLSALEGVRNERLAHRELLSTATSQRPGIDAEIQAFYLDMQRLIVNLVQVTENNHLVLEEVGKAHGEAAKLFWITGLWRVH